MGFSGGRLRVEPFSFTGSAGEYFRIWIVNLFLTIITIGIYSPWAKVRRLKYYYGKTWVDQHNFDYTANPIQILKGRLIVVAVLVLYNVLINVSPLFFILIIPYLIALPWIINQSMRFNARMTAYRNVRFGFKGTPWKATEAFVFWPIAVSVTAGLLAPLASRNLSNYIGSVTEFGTRQFVTSADLKPFWRNWFASVGVFVLVLGLGVGLVAAIVFSTSASLAAFQDLPEDSLYPVLAGFAVLAVFFLLQLGFYFYRAGVRNIAFNATTLEGGHALKSTLSRKRYIFIIFTNLIATLFTLGLAHPWAAVRTWRYLAGNTFLGVNGSLNDVVDEAHEAGNVATAEFLDFEGIDFGL